MTSYFLGKTSNEAIWKGYRHGVGQPWSGAQDSQWAAETRHGTICLNRSIPNSLVNKKVMIFLSLNIWDTQMGNERLWAYFLTSVPGNWLNVQVTQATGIRQQDDIGSAGGNVRCVMFQTMIYQQPTSTNVTVDCRIDGGSGSWKLWNNSGDLQSSFLVFPVYGA